MEARGLLGPEAAATVDLGKIFGVTQRDVLTLRRCVLPRLSAALWLGLGGGGLVLAASRSPTSRPAHPEVVVGRSARGLSRFLAGVAAGRRLVPCGSIPRNSHRDTGSPAFPIPPSHPPRRSGYSAEAEGAALKGEDEGEGEGGAAA